MATPPHTTRTAQRGGTRASDTAVHGTPSPKITWVRVDQIRDKGHGVELTHAALPDTILAFVEHGPGNSATVEILHQLPATLPRGAAAQLKRAVRQVVQPNGKWVDCPDILPHLNG